VREQYLDFLSKVEIFKTLTPVELEKLCDSIKVEKFKKNEVIIKKGVRGDTFFIVLEGKTRAFDEDYQTNELFPVAEYHEGMYFGELALIRHQPRAMHVIAQVR
jgi:cAMP-dependent protein kinase regulator